MEEFKDSEKNSGDESCNSSAKNRTISKLHDIDDPYGLLNSEHIAAAAEDAAAVSRREKGRKRKYKTADERREANRKLAAASRQRKKSYVEHLSKEIEKLQKENEQLRNENCSLKSKKIFNQQSSLAASLPHLNSQHSSLRNHSQYSSLLHNVLAQNFTRKLKCDSASSLLNSNAMARQAIPSMLQSNEFGVVNMEPTVIDQGLTEIQNLSSGSSFSSNMSCPEDLEQLTRKRSRTNNANLRSQVLNEMTVRF